MSSKIEWTDVTWNPIPGCSKVSPGCANCYAERMAKRQTHLDPNSPYKNVVSQQGWNGKTYLCEDRLDQPRHWKRPRVIFVNSMGDLFHESTMDEWIDSVLKVIANCPQHTFLALTKRPERMAEYIGGYVGNEGLAAGVFDTDTDNWPLGNLLPGVTAEDQTAADKRIPTLRRCPAQGRFVSCEPLLGPIDFWSHLNHGRNKGIRGVIVGGESGPGARPMHPAWVRWIRDQCAAARVPFFFKQWGAHRPVDRVVSGAIAYAKMHGPRFVALDDHTLMERVGKKPAGRLLDGRTHDDLAWRIQK